MDRVDVPADGLPIPVANWTGDQSTALACGTCGALRQAEPDELGLEAGLGKCPDRSCSGWLEWAYGHADSCRSCGALGWHAHELSGCCSRACMLQVEYAAELKARARP